MITKNTSRANWKAKKAKASMMARQTREQLALRRSRERALLLRKHFESGGITSLSALIARAVAEEGKDLHGSLSHEALRMVLEARSAKAGGHE